MSATALRLDPPTAHSATFPAHAGEDPYAVWAQRLAASDDRALNELIRETQDVLVRYARGMVRDTAVARDLVQDVFVRIWKNRERLDPNRSLKKLLFVAVRNRVRNRVRDEQRRSRALEERGPPQASIAPPAPARLEGAELAAKLEEWIEELPERQAEALRLSRFEHLSHQEIADVMEVSVRTVNNHLVRALRHLRQRIQDYDPELLTP